MGVFCPDSTVTVLNLTGFERWSETDSGRDCDILLLTASFGSSPEDPKARGLELLRQLRGRAIFPAVISLAEDGNELTAVRALQLGAVVRTGGFVMLHEPLAWPPLSMPGRFAQSGWVTCRVRLGGPLHAFWS